MKVTPMAAGFVLIVLVIVLVATGGLAPWAGALLFIAGAGAWVLGEFKRQRSEMAPSPAAVQPLADAEPLPSTLTDIHLKWLAEHHPDPLILLNGEDRVILANRAALDLVGSDMNGKLISAIYPRPRILEAIEQARATGLRQTVAFASLVPIEQHFEANIEAMAQGAGEGRTNGPVMIVMRDLTALKRVERLRTDFIANASHELRTPLASLTGFIETLKGPARDDPEAQVRFLGIMEVQAHRMGRLIQDLLSLSRIEQNEHILPQEEVYVPDVVEDVIDMLAPIAVEQGITIERQFGGNAMRVLGDRDQLIQVFQNLVENAIKYGGKGHTVTITTGNVDSTAEYRKSVGGGAIVEGRSGARPQCFVSVKDEGAGISRDQLSRLTERFYRVATERGSELRGTGLGLAIVKHIVNRHRGALVIDSDLGLGSSFTVLMPVAPKQNDDLPLPAPDTIAVADG